MPRLSNEDITTVLSDIANESILDKNATIQEALRALSVALIITDFVAEQSESFVRLYDKKLKIPEEYQI